MRNKIKVCYVELNGSEFIADVTEIREVVNGCYSDMNGSIVRLDCMTTRRGVRRVYSLTHSKCQEVLKKSVEDEIRTLTIGLDEMKGRV